MTTSPSPIEPRHSRAGRIPVSLTLCVLDGSAGVPPALGSTRNCQRSGRDAHAPGKAPKHGCARRAFTLVEMLLVISIISLILGMLVSTVRAVRRFSRQTITCGEIKNIEAAWKQFYAHYQYWPNAGVIGDVVRTDVYGDARYELLAPLARMLEGSNITDIVGDPAGITTYNADRIAFLELSRFNGHADPINAWGRDRTIFVADKTTPNTYIVIFDANGDNQITVELPGEPATNIFRSVAVWTENPEYSAGAAAGGGPPHYFGSWME